MDMFAPEFSRLWLSDDEDGVVQPDQRHDDDRRIEQKALEELAERVTAARSII